MNVHTIDLVFQGVPGIIAAYLVECGGELALIETGPGSTLDVLRRGIQHLGFRTEAVRHVFVTHIHLDHAGAAGWWAQHGARIYCHPNAARHLMDPAKLIESARLVYAAAMDSLWGEMLPAPQECVTVLQDGESVTVGNAQVVAWNTPGHARHHHAYSIDDVCFTGDVAGLRLEYSDYISVTAAPPQFDPVAYVASVERLKAANFGKLYLTHFGEIMDVAEHLENYARKIDQVHQQVRSWVTAGCDHQELHGRYREAERHAAELAGVAEALWQRYEVGNNTAMCADGVRLFVEKAPSA